MPETPWKYICSGSIFKSGVLQSSTQIVTYTTVLRWAQMTGGNKGLKKKKYYKLCNNVKYNMEYFNM